MPPRTYVALSIGTNGNMQGTYLFIEPVDVENY